MPELKPTRVDRITETASPLHIDLKAVRRQIVGSDFLFRTPFGERLMIYADYTASGRNVRFLERYLMKIQDSYANTHTEDDETGRSTTEMLHHAERIIKRAVNGNDETCIIAAGTGTTGAIQKLQEIIGVYIPPATRDWIETEAERFVRETDSRDAKELLSYLRKTRPVVFVGPYEHHSNEVSWRESLAEVVEIGILVDGRIDLDDLERRLCDPEYDGRRKIGSFSAASNVTGVRTPVYDVARILHRNGALACFDFAASAPYVAIDMNRDDESYFDALFFSPHKFLGGPGSSGILLFNRKIYRTDLPPTFAAGGTVDYVGPLDHDFTADIEAREKAGTPGSLQAMKAALAMELKHAIGVDLIQARDRKYIRSAVDRFTRKQNIEILGRPDPDNQIASISFNIKHGERYLHPKLVTRLFNDLFGIQSRAGCSCAGPYGHKLLHIGLRLSEMYRDQINTGRQGIKPGWVRIGFHYTMDSIDFEYVCRATEFLAEYGFLFIPLYRFDLETGTWAHTKETDHEIPEFGLRGALDTSPERSTPLTDKERRDEFDRYLREASEIAGTLERDQPSEYRSLPGVPEELTYFHAANLE